MSAEISSLSDERLGQLLDPYGVTTNHRLCERIRNYTATLLKWNEKIALTTIRDVDDIVRFHFGESMFAVSKLNISKGRLADIGSGAGFPGIPIRMVATDLQLTLIESNKKKAAFLCEIVRVLDLAGVDILPMRMEQATGTDRNRFDFVTARAIGNYEALLQWSRQQLYPGGMLILWLGSEEIRKMSVARYWNWRDPVAIPGSRSRFLLAGSLV